MELIIKAEQKHLDDLLEMAVDLWPDEDRKVFEKHFVKIFNTDNNKVLLFIKSEKIVGFIYLSIRVDYVEGSDSSPTGYIEGIYVKPGFRKSGIARKLFLEGEKWLKENGCRQIGSDVYIDNDVSYEFHTKVGFKVAGRLVTFIKDIDHER